MPHRARDLQLFAYENLAPHQVHDILLVASPYDSFILEEEGRFSDRLLGQYQELDLASPPAFHKASSARKALARMRKESFDLVLTTPHVDDMSPAALRAAIAESHPDVPVVLLTYDRADAQVWSERVDGAIDDLFLWTGDPRLLMAIVKSVEDRRNVRHDTRHGLVRVIVVVEDSPSFYSSFLPIIYAELLEQIRVLLADRLNERDRNYRMRARPKILLARTFEEGTALVRRYKDHLLGVISDVRFPRRGKLDPVAGLELVQRARRMLPDLPVLLQSREREHAEMAEQLGVAFADKNSAELLGELREFMRGSFGFGPFVFRSEDGSEVRRAETIREMLAALREVPDESLHYHAARNHVSNWLMARCEFPLALEVRPRQVTDFATTGELREYLVGVFEEFLEQRQRGQVTDFRGRPDPLSRDFLRIGRGSMGGKARSIAFMAHYKADHPLSERYPGVKIIVPRTVVICTDVFDRFCARNGLRERAMEAESDEEVARLFLAQPLDFELMADLATILSEVRYPLAVRSSSLLEDSEYQPLAGLYRTYLLPNCAESDEIRLEQLSRAVRLVFASTFFRGPRTSLEASSLRIEEEKMAVVVQRLVGRRYGDRFYPHFAGVAQTHNYYPIGRMKPEDGIVTAALGLGHAVVSDGIGLRFSPAHPEALFGMSTPEEALAGSQRKLYALDLSEPEVEIGLDEAASLVELDLDAALADGTLEAVGATYDPEADRVYDTVHRAGPKLVNFAGVLKHGRFPLAELLRDLLALGRQGMGTPLEMEFAVTLPEGAGERSAGRENGGEAKGGGPNGGEAGRAEMAILQLRPLSARGVRGEVDLPVADGRPVLLAGPALGHGVIDGVRDVVYVRPDRFDTSETVSIARTIARINDRLAARRRPYLLVGPGRWGTADRFLGIPVAWQEVSAARVIVELAVPGGRIDPSQGTHFFHNIVSLRVGYFSLDPAAADQTIDLAWLDAQPAVEEEGAVRRIELAEPVETWIDGEAGRGVVLRGGGERLA